MGKGSYSLFFKSDQISRQIMEDNFSPQQSLIVIQNMIAKTKANLKTNRFYFLFWGWLTLAALLTQFFMKVVLRNGHHFLVWLMVIPATIITIIYSYRNRRTRAVRTYIGDSMTYLWTGIGISFFVLSFIITNTGGGWLNAYPFFILFYGLGTFVSGRILQFKPFVIGGIFNWILA